MGAFSPSSKVTTQYKAVYIEKNVGTRSPRLLTHMVIKEVKSEVGRANIIFFTLLVHRIDTLQILVVRTQNPLVQRKKKLPKQIGCGWLRCHDENRWMMNRQYPKTAATLVTNRGMFLANCTKHVILDLSNLTQGNSSFHACLNRRTRDSSYFSFSHIWRAIFLVCLRLSLIPFLTLDFPEVEQTHRVLLSEHHGFRDIFSKNKRAKDI